MELVGLAPDASQVVSTADFTAPAHGARISGYGERAWYARPTWRGSSTPPTTTWRSADVFPLERAAEAHAASQTGRARGKRIISVRPEVP